MTDYGDHHDGPRSPVDPAWGPPTGPPALAPPPGGPSGSDDTGSRTRPRPWSRLALLIGAAAVGFAVAVPTAAVLRESDGPAAVPVTPQVSVAPESGGSGTTSAMTDLYRGLVDIDTRLAYEQGRAAGTGMVVTEDGQVLTNAHVIDGAASIVVTVVATGESYDATVLGSDETRDVALLQLEDASGLATVILGDSSSVEPGDAVVALGNSTGTGDAPSVSEGTVTGVDESITVGDQSGDFDRLSGLIETDASLSPGDSGGPMFNADGEVIGISTAADGGRRFPGRDSESYAVAIDTAESIADQIRSGDGSDTVQIGIRGFLGVQIDAETQSAGGVGGAVIAEVLDGTPAEDAGLQAGDVITGIGGEEVDSGDGLSAGLHGFQPGDEVTVDWTDASGAARSATVTLTTGPA